MRPKQRPAPVTRETAEAVAARCFLFLAEDGGRLTRFLAESGLAPADLQTRADDPDLLAAILGHVIADESALLAFAANAGLAPETVVKAGALMGLSPHWDST